MASIITSFRLLQQALTAIPAPNDYFSGLSWQQSCVPDSILCFHREHQDHTLTGHEGISERSGKYDQHHRFVLLIPLLGEGAIGVEQSIIPLRETQAMLIFPHQLHYYTDLPEKFDWMYITFEIPAAGQIHVEALRNSPRGLTAPFLQKLEVFTTMYRGCREGEAAGNELELALVLQQLLFELRDNGIPVPGAMEAPTKAEDGARAEIVHQIKNYLYGKLDQDIAISDVAHHVGFSESYVRAAFKKRVGISLGQFILAVRLTHAARLLKTTQRRIADIGRASGFESQLSFSRAFKRSFGMSPREYRREDVPG